MGGSMELEMAVDSPGTAVRGLEARAHPTAPASNRAAGSTGTAAALGHQTPPWVWGWAKAGQSAHEWR